MEKLEIPNAKNVSENGNFWCTYEIGEVTDEMRKLFNFKFYKGNNLTYSLPKLPGSDVEISNSGLLVVYDHSEHFKNKLTLHFYSSEGNLLNSFSFTGAGLIRFSEDGNKIGIRSKENITVISPLVGIRENFPKGYKFSFSEDGNLIAIASENRILVYSGSHLLTEIHNEIVLPREVAISSRSNLLCMIDKYNLLVYSLSSGDLLWRESPDSETSFRDIKIYNGKIFAGLHKSKDNISAGLLKIYDQEGEIIETIEGPSKGFKSFQSQQRIEKTRFGYDPIPWMFEPFDSMRTIWNHYEQHMGSGSDWSYLHQGLDLITPIGELVYAVADGVVKCVLTLGGDVYWRMAVSDSQVPGVSNGWLYAHLIESTIQFEEGDTVNIHDYLGDIVAWTSEWGHIHFVEIQDSGTIWFYNDNEWGITFNPMLALDPLPDFTPPVIENAFVNSKFAFCTNETSNYLDADSLYGEIDIILKVIDYAGDSEWQQPAFETYYWIRNLHNNIIVVPRKLGHILNHFYPFYDGSQYEPYATVIYKRDNIFPSPSWMDPVRGFYHVLTNSNGDSLIDLSEKNLSLNTANFIDGSYRIYAEVFDEAGNSDLDSMDVKFRNGTVPVELLSLSASYTNKLVSLVWSTATEINNRGFEIERSTNKTDWRLLRFKEGNGTTTEIHNYSFVDDLFGLTSQKLYYRLKQIDFNGSFEYSDVVEINVAPSSFSLSQNYPNPFNPTTSIQYAVSSRELVTLKVYDVLGIEVSTLVNEEKSPGVYEIEFDGSNLASGVYYYQFKTGDFVETKKMILMK